MAIKKYIGPNRLSEIFSYIKAELDKKVTVVSGKGLSSNDYTTTEKNKLAGISSGAEVNVQADWDVDNTSSDAYILHKPTSMPASDVPSWAKQPNKPSYTFSEITSKPTTIAGYGITDAKIANGTITLGSNSITPLTQHQDISGKADKATTLAGYGITDAKIANGTITLGSNSITPLTQHQSVTNKGATLAWSSAVTVATIGSTDIKVSLPANPNTDTKVTSVGNHYAPAEDSTAQLDADASSSTAATWNSTSLVTGVTVKRDAKGHITGLAVDSIKMPANPNTNTTYTFADGTNGFTVTPSGGTAQTVKVTPSITNNVTGSGTSGYLAKFNGANTITSGPQLGSGTTTYLRNDGSWATPPDTNTTYTIATGDSNGQIKVTPSSGSAYNVSVKGLGSNAYSSTAYLPLAGGTVTGKINRDAGGSWIQARNNALIMTTRTSGQGADWHPAVAIKTSSGCWSFGSVGGESLSLSYDTDADYSAGSNTSKVINFPTAGKTGTIALTSDIPTKVSQFTNDSGYITSSGSCASATKATQDGSGNVITTTYMKKGADYVTAGQLAGTTVGSSATVEGKRNTASESYSHAEGYETVASGVCSHSEGSHTIAASAYQLAIGQYNEEDTNGFYYFIIGNGASSQRKNIFTVNKSGQAWSSGGLATDGDIMSMYGDLWAGQSTGLANSTKIPTGADVVNYCATLNKFMPGAGTNNNWRNCANGYAQWYYYEGGDTTTLNLPYPHVFIQVYKANSGRGVAMAYQWPFTSKGIWIAGLHDTWSSWERVK